MPVPAITPRAKVIAFYLPQFHPIPENDRWWGKGFTEWTNVTRARPLFEGHYQPRLPADLGFYDLRLPEVMEAQAELARRYDIFGFCYHYYWFAGGRRLLERPLNQMFASGKPDFPFCLCWANENWTRRWDGAQSQVLMPQSHDPQSDVEFLRSVLPHFRDRRYIRVNGRPLLVVYRATLFPDLAATVSRWHAEARAHGEQAPYLVAAESFDVTGPAVTAAGFDATCEFPPHGMLEHRVPSEKLPRFFAPFSGVLLDYERIVDYYLTRRPVAFRRFNTVTLAWDNTARKKSAANIMVNFSLATYHRWLKGVIDRTSQFASPDERIVFVNAWNEWAEGTYLEPDQLYGHEFLAATRAAIHGAPSPVSLCPWRTIEGDRTQDPLRAGAETSAARVSSASRSRIAAIAVVGNEEDIIESFVRENLRYVDHMLVIVDRATDATSRILRALAGEGLPLTVRLGADGNGERSALVNGLLREAIAARNADWIIALDADEFIDVAARAGLESALAGVGPRHGRMPWVIHAPTAFDDMGQVHPLKRLRYRYAYEIPPPDANPGVWRLAINCRLFAPYVDRYELNEGLHGLVFRGSTLSCHQPIGTLAGVVLRHYPLRRLARDEMAGAATGGPHAAAEVATTHPHGGEFLDAGWASMEHGHGAPLVVDPFLPSAELRYGGNRRLAGASVEETRPLSRH